MDNIHAKGFVERALRPEELEKISSEDIAAAKIIVEIAMKSERHLKSPSIWPPSPCSKNPGVFFNYETNTWYRGRREGLISGSNESRHPGRTFPVKGLRGGKIERYSKQKMHIETNKPAPEKLVKETKGGSKKSKRVGEVATSAFRTFMTTNEKRVVFPYSVARLKPSSNH